MPTSSEEPIERNWKVPLHIVKMVLADPLVYSDHLIEGFTPDPNLEVSRARDVGCTILGKYKPSYLKTAQDAEIFIPTPNDTIHLARNEREPDAEAKVIIFGTFYSPRNKRYQRAMEKREERARARAEAGY